MSVIVVNVRAVLVNRPDGDVTWTVVDRSGLVIDEVDRFLNGYLRATAASLNTVRSYARHLALFFRWLAGRSAHWETLSFDGLCTFTQDLQDGSLRSLRRPGEYRPQQPRGRTSCEAVLAALYSFLTYWQLEGRGPVDLRLYRNTTTAGRSKYSFLAHVEARRSQVTRRIKVRGPKAGAPAVIDFESDFLRLLGAALTFRDRTLLSCLYDGGLRISQALGLRHEDLDIARKKVAIVRRTDNANGALSKQRDPFKIDMPQRFFEFYAASLVEEQLDLGIDSDYVFVNLEAASRGRPLSYSNAAQVVRRTGLRVGITLTPHTLRHTHGTFLAKQGWSAPEIAKRLGQSSASSADVYIHLADDHIAEKYAAMSAKKADHNVSTAERPR
ncbi:site-specific recombinase XerD [Nakamurella sp. UYEF19]|uniref:tyrosine-type recombinase/integrase n=1 Tax=Nakamurella sp. UYEF19 TaxID=1756392 RepID=UPI003399AA7B